MTATPAASAASERASAWGGEPLVEVGAFRVTGNNSAITYGPRKLPDDVIRRLVDNAERQGLLVASCHDGGDCGHPLVFDLYAHDGIVDDRCVVDEAAWALLNAELELAGA